MTRNSFSRLTKERVPHLTPNPNPPKTCLALTQSQEGTTRKQLGQALGGGEDQEASGSDEAFSRYACLP